MSLIATGVSNNRFFFQKKKNSAKLQKLEGQTSVHDGDVVDKVTFRCQGKHNLWEARKAVSKDVDLSNEKTIPDKQILTNYICEVLCRGIQLKMPRHSMWTP